jgi:LytS/YehU family sensor histidine kinase
MVLEKKPEEAYSYLEKFSKLIRRILELSEKSMVAVHDELETLRLYMDLENLRLDGKFDYEINASKSVSLVREIPSLITQPYVENSIWHGVMPLEGERGKIIINIDQKEEELIIEILDNGVGRNHPEEGMGTRIVSELVRKFKGDQSGEVEIEDLMQGDKPAGTKVSIRILDAVYDESTHS